MTWILVLLCLAIAGRELYLAFDRKRPAGSAPELDDIRTRLSALTSTRDELERFRSLHREQAERLATTQAEQAESLGETDARIRSLITQINDRMLPEVNTRLSQQREAADHLTTEVAQLRDHLIGRLDQAVATSLGSVPVDTIAGALSPGPLTPTPPSTGTHSTGSSNTGRPNADPPSTGSFTTGDRTGEPRTDLAYAYELFAGRYGLRVELTDPAAYKVAPSDEPESGQLRYYLSGASPRSLESDFLALLHQLSTIRRDHPETRLDDLGTEIEAAGVLLDALHQTERAGAQIGPLVIVRTADALLCGVLPLAELRKTEPAALVADPSSTAARLRTLPPSRFHDATRHAPP
ncbi:hypothetical protein [Actinomadura sp. 9N407]|uniref:hypothetical protein n=1 Tax=Actinomadura sp. 9N407 TaxID=3375154 RepID=UPI0037B8885D